MDPPQVFKEGETAPGGFGVENILNREDGTLPFGLYNPSTEGKLTWICNYGTEGDIISVFCMDLGGRNDRDVKILKDLDEAKYFYDELVKAGWRKLIPPKIEFTVSGENGKPKPFSRRERRHLAKKIKQASKYHEKNEDPEKEPEKKEQ